MTAHDSARSDAVIDDVAVDAGAVDDGWGRVPGLRPPLPARAPLVWFAALALALTAVVVVLVRPPGPLDQSDPAYQRDGLLLDGPVVPPEVAGVGFGDRPVVLLFDRALPDADALAGWLAGMRQRAAVRLVVPEPVPRARELAGVPVVADPTGRLAAAVDLPTPVDGGPGIGYAVVDSDRRVRYSTLDPAYLANAFEVATIVGSVP
ncbi:MAG: hypothetical protein ACR2K2_03495 [Mycobacteriales bacterium]